MVHKTFVILVQLRLLNTFLTSRGLPHSILWLHPAIWCCSLLRAELKSVVDRSLRKPNWLSDMTCTCSACSSIRLLIMRSKTFPVVSSIQRGLQEDGICGGLFPFAHLATTYKNIQIVILFNLCELYSHLNLFLPTIKIIISISNR